MEVTTIPTLSSAAKEAAATKLNCKVNDLVVNSVSGGYSLNRRALVGHDDEWLFVKEVDKAILSGDGAEELAWLQKDYELTNHLRSQMPDIIPEWSQLVADDHSLLMSSYRSEDGWLWSLPTDNRIQHAYIQAVIDATKRIETAELDSDAYERLKLQPYFRDKLAYDDGLDLIIHNESIREQLNDKYESMLQTEAATHLRMAYRSILALLNDDEKLKQISLDAKNLANQPNDYFNHCDVRSDNLTYNPRTDEIKFVDWNWASYAPSKFGSTEFLIDMARRGVNVTPWKDELNRQLLAATVGVYANHCLWDPLSPESTLREMQAESAAISLSLYEMTDKQPV
jgi:hypothetical protein